MALAGVGIWRAVSIGSWSPDDVARYDDWETAAPKDCPLMARAVAAYGASHNVGSLPLLGKAAGPCDWPHFGLRLARVTEAEFEAATAGPNHETGYIPHLSLGRPRYSLFHLRAVVNVGSEYGWLGGGGDDCEFRLGANGWHLRQCRRAWIS
jgi:hypothetical protein